MIKFMLLAAFGGLALFYFFQDALVFLPRHLSDENRQRFARYAMTFQHEGATLHGWFVRGEISARQPLLVYYGGNAEEVSYNLWLRERYPTSSMLFVNYRGYGDSTGEPSQQALFGDALYILDTLMEQENIAPEHIILMGRSLGSAVAVYVASQRPVRGVILVLPFDRLAHVGQEHYPWLPVDLMLKYPFDSLSRAPGIEVPALFVLAEQDHIIPKEASLNLRDHWGGPVRTAVIEGAGHNDIGAFPAYWQALDDFVHSLVSKS